jgi:hypothetical protein
MTLIPFTTHFRHVRTMVLHRHSEALALLGKNIAGDANTRGGPQKLLSSQRGLTVQCIKEQWFATIRLYCSHVLFLVV